MVTSAQSVVWTGQGISDPSVLNPVVTPTQTTTYYADFTSGNCTNFDSVTVEVIPGPITDLGADTSYCDPMSAVELSTIFDANYTYFWEPSFLLSDPRIHNPTITTFTSSDFILTARDQSTGCSLKDTISIEFGTTPQLSTSDDVTICEGESVQLFVNGADVYSWSNPSTLDCGDCQSVTASPNTTTTYVITGTNASICETVDSITVFVEGMIQFTDETITICEGDSIEVDGVIYNQNAEIPIVTPSASTCRRRFSAL